MASGHVNRANRPNTWLHRPAPRREKPLPTRSQWYGPRPPSDVESRSGNCNEGGCHADRSSWSGSWRSTCLRFMAWTGAGKSCVRKTLASRCRVALLCQFAAVPGWHGSLERRALLGKGAFRAWPRGAADQPAVRDAVRQVQQERSERCRGHLRSGRPANDALRADEIRRSVGGAGGSSHSPPSCRRPGQARQSNSRPSF